MDDSASDVGQAEVAAGVVVRQPLVIHAEQMQRGRVQVVHVDFVLDRVMSPLVGLAVSDARLYAASCQPDREAAGIVVSAMPFCWA